MVVGELEKVDVKLDLNIPALVSHQHGQHIPMTDKEEAMPPNLTRAIHFGPHLVTSQVSPEIQHVADN